MRLQIPTCRLVLCGAAAVGLMGLAGCGPSQPKAAAVPVYDSAPVERRNIEVSVDAAGVIEPITTVEVKSKASGEILAVHAENGDVVNKDTLLVEIDKRTPRNLVLEAESTLKAAQAGERVAETSLERSEKLFKTKNISQADLDKARLDLANAKSKVVGSQVALENSRIALDDTEVRAPITGTVMERTAEPGAVISSPTQAVSGGTVLMKMADLRSVRVRTLVDETDIGKIHQGMAATVIVAAYPNQPFSGDVLKIEPVATVQQNVTMFPVLIRLDNSTGLLRPGMNCEVSIKIAKQDDVLTVPTAALRTMSDIPATAAMLGMPVQQLRSELGVASATGADSRDAISARGAQAMGSGQRVARANAQRGSSGQSGSRSAGAEGAASPAGGAPGAHQPSKSTSGYQFGGDYWVVALDDNKPAPTRVQTGLTDFRNSAVLSGLGPDKRVLLLPSSSLYSQQAKLQQFISRRFGSSPFQQGR